MSNWENPQQCLFSVFLLCVTSELFAYLHPSEDNIRKHFFWLVCPSSRPLPAPRRSMPSGPLPFPRSFSSTPLSSLVWDFGVVSATAVASSWAAPYWEGVSVAALSAFAQFVLAVAVYLYGDLAVFGGFFFCRSAYFLAFSQS
jgi:hypothetical protein